VDQSAAQLRLADDALKMRPTQEVFPTLPSRTVVSVANRSVLSLDYAAPGTITFNRSPGGLGPSMGAALATYGHAVVYATAMNEAEAAVAETGNLISCDGRVWIRYLSFPQQRFQQFYDDIANRLLYFVFHELAETLGTAPSDPAVRRDPLVDYAPGRLAKAGEAQQPVFTPDMEHSFAQGYRWVNGRYADSLAAELVSLRDPKLLVHDYHLLLVPELLRRHCPERRQALFVHTPWPSAASFAVLPVHVQHWVLTGMLGADIIGFQTARDQQRFLASAEQRLNEAVQRRGDGLTWNGERRVEVLANPITVDPDQVETTALTPGAAEFASTLRERVDGRVLIVRVERIDIIKGVLEGLLGLQRLLQQHPHLRSQVHMFILGQRSRIHIPEYQTYYLRVREVMRRINAEFSPHSDWDGLVPDTDHRHLMLNSTRWPAVVLYEAKASYEHVLGAMAAADIGLFNSLADGMNLAIKEFLLVNEPRVIERIRARCDHSAVGSSKLTPGIAVGSSAMGAMNEVHGTVLSVETPQDPASVAHVLEHAIHLVRQDRKRVERMAAQAAPRVRDRTLFQWVQTLLDPL
jgi:trehalose 6-phosphate synthase